jgi:hypothetical protein
MLYNDHILCLIEKQRLKELERLVEQARLFKAIKSSRPVPAPHVLTNLKRFLTRSMGGLLRRVDQAYRQTLRRASDSLPENSIGSQAAPQQATTYCNCS